ncbi:hypothetical protein SAMD00019534_102480 [Acytostelium subglobosum LB1]|uniref:hypothetical protein n=1 Tax=Acytostelium subglobosum LB1 TaxID=1410327 RepID=UPI000644A76F|nr:hypothetical protein SAMD00019534_102480 [Acytostelium subglobosum LB1]GAM27073.1 hypothetical protein SAMD00019534_102480 [Acytostelium subglobosum LB1]|eukprot:XP_012749953.1 hypothetical protein SAMD00019534_102480 [Acytostelium subglobosum LB1]
MSGKFYLFDKTGSHFAAIGRDNILRVWNVQKNIITFSFSSTNNDVKFNCLTWFSMKQVANPKLLLAAGMTNGDINIYDILDGKQLKSLTGSHSCRVNDVVFAGDAGNHLYSADQDGTVIQWSVEQAQKITSFAVEENRPVFKLAVNAHATRLVSGASQVRIWELSSQQQIGKIKSSKELRSLAFSDETSRDVLVGSTADRYMRVYELSDKGLKSGEASHMIRCDTNIRGLHMLTQPTKLETFYYFAAITDAKVIEVFKATAQKTVSSQTKFKLQDNVDLISVTFLNSEELALAQGPLSSPSQIKFEIIKFSQKGELLETTSNIEYHSKDPKSKGGVGSTSKQVVSTTGDAAQLNVEEQIIGVDMKSVDNSAKNAGTVVDMITQALQSSDIALLSRALQVNQVVLQNTVKALPSPYAFSLLKRIISDLATDYQKSHYLISWVNNIIKEHSTYLLTVPNLRSQLSILNSIVEDKFKLHESLTKLVAKCELVESKSQSKKVVSIDFEPVLVYQDNSEDENDESEDSDDMDDDALLDDVSMSESDDQDDLGSDLDDEDIADLMDGDDMF